MGIGIQGYTVIPAGDPVELTGVILAMRALGS